MNKPNKVGDHPAPFKTSLYRTGAFTPYLRLSGYILLILFLILALSVPVIFNTAPKPRLLEGVHFSSKYLSADHQLLQFKTAHDGYYRLFTPLAEMPLELIELTLLQEDRYFYAHPGINPFSLIRAAAQTYVLGNRPIGGSTITMQVVRLRDKLHTRSLSGKFTQIWRALLLDWHYSKKDILQAYLNLAPYGGNIEGVGAAALIYFNQTPKDLTLPQSLGLVVIPQNPNHRRPDQSRNQNAWQQARQKLYRKYAKAFQPPEQQAQLVAMPLPTQRRDQLPFKTPHFISSLTHSNPEPTHSILTTIDTQLQSLIERHVKDYIQENSLSGIDNAAAMLVDTRNMQVKSLIGSSDFLNPNIAGQVDGTAALRSPGSTLKTFVYALALEQGLIHPKSVLEDKAIAFAEYRPTNFDDRFMGNVSADQALQLSRNIPAIKLATQLASPTLFEFLQQAQLNLPFDHSHYGLSLVIGGAEISMRQLVSLYAMLSNGGILQPLRYLQHQARGQAINLLSPEAALLTLKMLGHPHQNPLPFTHQSHKPLPLYWKTGTSSGLRDAWTVGVFGHYVLAVWLGHFDGRANPALIGSNIAAPLFFKIADHIHALEKTQDEVSKKIEHLGLKQIALCGPDATPQLKPYQSPVPQAERHSLSQQQSHCQKPIHSFFIAGKSPIKAHGISDKAHMLSPQAGVTYALTQLEASGSLPFQARFPNASFPLYWFVDHELVGVSLKGEPIYWNAWPGQFQIRVMDQKGEGTATVISVVAAK